MDAEPDVDGPERWVGRSGREFRIRPIVPGDAEGLLAFGKRMPPRTVRLRFFTPRVDFDSAYWRQLARHFANVDYHKRIAFVATSPCEEGILAVGRYEEDSPDSAEVAFVVDTTAQGEGIATRMLQRLASHARREGYVRLTATTFAENASMLDIFRRCGFPARFVRDGEFVRAEMDIGEGPATPPGGSSPG